MNINTKIKIATIILFVLGIVMGVIVGMSFGKVKTINASERAEECLANGGEYSFARSNKNFGNWEFCTIEKTIEYSN